MNHLNLQTSSRPSNKPLIIKWVIVLFVLLALIAIFSRKEKKMIENNIPALNTAIEEPENVLAQEKQETKEIFGRTLYVSLDGDDKNTGLQSTLAVKSIQKAIDMAEPGDTIRLADGEYVQDIISRKDGTAEKRITLEGSPKAVLKGDSNSRVIEINHSYITLRGFTVDGLNGSSKKIKNYKDKLIYAQGKGQKKGVSHLLIENMTIQNAGGECIRLRYFAENNEVSHSTIRNCGIYDFLFDKGGKNGEGIYIGTAPEQLSDGRNPTQDTDISKNNWIHDNTFDTRGNECVDIKEGSLHNFVEHNTCTGQKDKNSGGMGARGNENVFRDNEIFDNKGAGIRLGGDSENYGINNFIYRNSVRDNKNGGIKVEQKPQGKICQNNFNGNKNGDFVGSYENGFKNSPSC